MAREGALRKVDAVGSGAPVGWPGAHLDRGARRGGARADPRAGADRGEPEPDRPVGQQSTDWSNHGKTPRKFIQDCTICLSCRWTISASALLKQQKNRTQMAGAQVVSDPCQRASRIGDSGSAGTGGGAVRRLGNVTRWPATMRARRSVIATDQAEPLDNPRRGILVDQDRSAATWAFPDVPATHDLRVLL